MTEKKCPKCNQTKSIDEYYNYYSKTRKKDRVSSYCKECSRGLKREYVKAYYQEHCEKRRAYAKMYREKNKEKVKQDGEKFRRLYIENLADCYVTEIAKKYFKCSTEEIKQNPELLKAYKLNLQIKRKIKENDKK